MSKRKKKVRRILSKEVVKEKKRGWNIFHANADENTIKVFGQERRISPTKLKVKVVLLKFEEGKVTEDAYESNIKSIDVWMVSEENGKEKTKR